LIRFLDPATPASAMVAVVIQKSRTDLSSWPTYAI
jgi:hypothetical protein